MFERGERNAYRRTPFCNYRINYMQRAHALPAYLRDLGYRGSFKGQLQNYCCFHHASSLRAIRCTIVCPVQVLLRVPVYFTTFGVMAERIYRHISLFLN